MGASEIGKEELQPKKGYHKINIDCTCRSEKTCCSGT